MDAEGNEMKSPPLTGIQASKRTIISSDGGGGGNHITRLHN